MDLKKMIRRILNFFIIAVLICAAVFIGFMIFVVATDYRPEEKIGLVVENNSSRALEVGDSVKLVTYNIGYGGLDAGQDFFLDGGSGSRAASLAQVNSNMQNISGTLRLGSADFILLQEVDKKADRSFEVDEVAFLEHAFPGHGGIFAVNYDVPYVPVPVTDPLGGILSGLLTLSKYKVDSATRFQYPGAEKWLRQLFELDRCFLESRIAVHGGKELVVINSHSSAYDKGGNVRKLQLGYLRSHIISEYEKGNYVIVGGDFNYTLPGADRSLISTEGYCESWAQNLPPDFTPPGFKWAVDGSLPTVRSIDKPYTPGKNCANVIDGFLASPNVEMISVQGKDLGFAFSDHQPVFASFKLK